MEQKKCPECGNKFTVDSTDSRMRYIHHLEQELVAKTAVPDDMIRFGDIEGRRRDGG